MDKEFELLLKALFSAIKIPISFFSADDILQYEYYYKKFIIPPKIRKEIVLPLFLKKPSDGNFPKIHKGNFNETYFSMALITNNRFRGTLVVGPFMQQRVSEDDIVSILQDLGIDPDEKDELDAFYKRLRLVTASEVNEISVHIYYYFYHKVLDVSNIRIDNRKPINNVGRLKNITPEDGNETDGDLYPPEQENYIIKAVKNGESHAFEQLDMAFLHTHLGISLNDTMEKVKPGVKSFITVLTEVIVAEGIDQKTAGDISAKYLGDLEKLDNMNDVVKFMKNVFIDYAERTAKLKNDVSSKTIRRCKQYIMNNPYSEITLKNLSELVGLNPSYLSRLFKVATGISVTEYSKMEKIEEAKIMIETDSHTLSEISVLLGFYDYNHFVKVFKSMTNTTPNQYKRYNTRKPARNV